jgi:hypothetical protein
VSRFDLPVVSSATTVSCARRFAASHSSANRSDATKRSRPWRIAASAPASIAGASTSACLGAISRASAWKSTAPVIFASSFSATAFCTAELRAIGAMVST